MSDEDIAEAVASGLSQREIARKFGLGHTYVRLRLKKLSLCTAGRPNLRKPVFGCVLCSRATVENRRMCRSCWTRVRRCRVRLLAITLLGGKCSKCGWLGHPSAFDFHHRSDKHFAIGSAANKSWSRVWKELKKCDLLCANCHRTLHSKATDPRLLAEAERFMRKGFCLENAVPQKTFPALAPPTMEQSILLRRKFVRPSKEELVASLESMPATELAEKLGVKSTTTIGKWCRAYGIETKPRGFWNKVYASRVTI